MGYWPINLLCIFILCVLLAGFLIPQILLIAFRRNLFDEVNERKIHKGLVPRLGGIAFVPVIFTSIAVALVTNIQLGFDNISQAFADSVLPFISTFIALELLYLVGMADDLIGIKYRAKFVVQIICAAFLISSGVWFSDLAGVLGIESVSPWFGYPFTLIVIVFLINAINLIDGIDGLASGLSGIAMIFYGFFFLAAGQWAYSMISFASLGTLVPFFYYNVFGNPARGKKIFMGDTGSLTTGLVLSFLALQLTSVDNGGVFAADALVVAFAPLAIPCLDVIRVFVHRVIRGNSPFLPDRVHIHHKLLALGFPQRPAMITILAMSAGVIGLDLLIAPSVSTFMIVVIDFAAWVVANYFLTKAIRARQLREGITHGYD